MTPTCVHAFVVTSKGVAAHKLRREEGLEAEARRLAALVRERPTMALRVRRASLRDLGRRVHAWLLPFAKQLRAYRSLRLSPGASLAHVPFPALLDADGSLVGEHHAVSDVLSSAQVASLPRGRRPIRRAVFVRGDDQVGESGPLAFADGELEQAARLVGARGVDVAMLRLPSWQAFRAALTGADLVHYAGHATFEPGHAMASGLFLDGGVVHATDVASLDLRRAALVVLSACETGRVSSDAGDEFIGLLRGIFAAGASAVLATSWLADDKTAADLMKQIYARWLSGAAIDEAVAASAADVRRTRADPYYWANFAAYGARVRCWMGNPNSQPTSL